MGGIENGGARKLRNQSGELYSLDGVHQPIILFADDEAMVRTLMTPMLEEQGFCVLSACDGQEALELSRKHPGRIDLVITDVDMPRLKGTDLCTHLLKERPGIKVIVMSGAAMDDINFPILDKPFLGETLMAKIREVLMPPQRANA